MKAVLGSAEKSKLGNLKKKNMRKMRTYWKRNTASNRKRSSDYIL